MTGYVQLCVLQPADPCMTADDVGLTVTCPPNQEIDCGSGHGPQASRRPPPGKRIPFRSVPRKPRTRARHHLQLPRPRPGRDEASFHLRSVPTSTGQAFPNSPSPAKGAATPLTGPSPLSLFVGVRGCRLWLRWCVGSLRSPLAVTSR